MFRINSWLLIFSILTVATTACALGTDPAERAGDAESEIVARVGDRAITAAELDKVVGPKLTPLRQQIYDVKTKTLEDMVFNQLVDEAATAAGVPKGQWLKDSLDAMTDKPTEEEIQKVMTQYRDRLAPDDEQARAQVVDYLTKNSDQKARAELRSSLMGGAGVEIYLDPPRVKPVLSDANPAKGPADAPVVLIEYTDFQCPYCGRVQGTLTQLRERYGDSLRTVFKNLPLAMHSQARFAAEAALCAGDQDGFWKMHSWMFANHRDIAPESTYAQAETFGLDTAALQACVDAGTYRAVVDADMVEASNFGITGTPGFVINGRILTGAQPFEAFVKLIDDELRRAGVEIPAAKEAQAEAATTAE